MSLATYLEGSGLDLERFEAVSGRANLVARIEGTDASAPSLLLMGHTDVVPVNADRWRHDPFGGEVIDGEVWGRGAVDMLNLTASMAVAFKHLATSGFKPKGTLIYLGVADEEALGTYGADYLVEHERDAVVADYVLTEAGGFPMDLGAGVRLPVIVGEKGTFWSTLRVTGTPGHASMPLRTDNALVKAAEVVRRLAEYKPETQIHDTWRRFVEDIGLPQEVVARAARSRSARGAVRRAAARHGTRVPRVHPHDLRADDHPRRHEDERHPRHDRPDRRHPHVARPG